ncbi:uncharacterized protein LOC143032278 [Oratosquilla oratoria]|uniref:uncharacterized protein LOC143032278 n=1 Tax=Oratosquilla oratoria TaxID=337810 RepID=UPI003F758D95
MNNDKDMNKDKGKDMNKNDDNNKNENMNRNKYKNKVRLVEGLPCAYKRTTESVCHHLQLPSRSQQHTSDSLQHLPDTCNMDYKLILLLALAAVALARPQDDDFPPANYNFEYRVQDVESGNDFGHNEARQGDDTQGSYDVLLPDGKKLVVSYTVGAEGGFIADATIDGVPLHQVA